MPVEPPRSPRPRPRSTPPFFSDRAFDRPRSVRASTVVPTPLRSLESSSGTGKGSSNSRLMDEVRLPSHQTLTTNRSVTTASRPSPHIHNNTGVRRSRSASTRTAHLLRCPLEETHRIEAQVSIRSRLIPVVNQRAGLHHEIRAQLLTKVMVEAAKFLPPDDR